MSDALLLKISVCPEAFRGYLWYNLIVSKQQTSLPVKGSIFTANIKVGIRLWDAGISI